VYPIIDVSSNITLTISNTVVVANSTTGQVKVKLPDAISNPGRYYFVKQESGTNDVIIKPLDGQTIDGSAAYTNSTVGTGRVVISDGTQWITMGVTK
jgi:hypothetical protein